jgi:hypothetical protein
MKILRLSLQAPAGARTFGQYVATRASKCPFGFQSPVRKEGKDPSTIEAASTAMQSPVSSSTPLTPAPSSFPEARNLGPGNSTGILARIDCFFSEGD